MTLPSPSTPIQQIPVEAETLRKWTIVNDEWVSVYRQIVRTSSGLREIQPTARSEK